MKKIPSKQKKYFYIPESTDTDIPQASPQPAKNYTERFDVDMDVNNIAEKALNTRAYIKEKKGS